MNRALFLPFLTLVLAAICLSAAEPRVTLLRTPEGGLQPQAAVDDRGTVHLLYLKGDPKACDIFYVTKEPGKESFSKPIRVNSQSGSAVAAGTIRGAHIALGKNGRVHVVWNGSMVAAGGAPPAETKGHAHQHAVKFPMLYSRLNDAGTGFEPQRNLMTHTAVLDGGGSVAADGQGNVWVFWHASPSPEIRGETNRAVFVARSKDDGRTFSKEVQANKEQTGACPCCGLRALADGKGNVYVLYRTATIAGSRDINMLFSGDNGSSFSNRLLGEWKVNMCPMSSQSLYKTGSGVIAAWENKGNSTFATLDPANGQVGKPVEAASSGRTKHPVAVANAKGDILALWTVGTGFGKGGALAWQLHDAQGRRLPEKGELDGVPAHSLATAYAQRNDFVIIY